MRYLSDEHFQLFTLVFNTRIYFERQLNSFQGVLQLAMQVESRVFFGMFGQKLPGMLFRNTLMF